MAEVTRDTLWNGQVALAQPARATAKYRVNVDAILLAEFAAGAGRRARAAFDLGAGVGAIALSLLHLDAATHVTLIEIDGDLAELARTNLAANGWSTRGEVVMGDVAERASVPSAAADLVVCNPPYVAPGRGRPAAPPRARARSAPLASFLDAARRVAGRRARVCFVYPAGEATTLLEELRARGLEPKRLRFVHGKASGPARIVLVEAVAGKRGGLVVEPPLVR